MRFFTSALMAGAATAFSTMESTYLKYLIEHGKGYKDIEEFTQRFSIFQGRFNRIQEINSQGNNFTLGLNKFSDWS